MKKEMCESCREILENQFVEFAKGVLYALIYGVVLSMAISMLLSRAEAKTVEYGTEAVRIPLKYGGPTIFRFSKAVQTITGASRLEIKPANAADPSYSALAVTPRLSSGTNEVSFFLGDGSVVRTHVLVSASDPAADSFYDFKPVGKVDSGGGEEQQTAPMSEVELLKAMFRDADVTGYTVKRVSDRESERKPGVEIELIRIYKGSPFNGYVYRLKNVSSKSVAVDVRHITVGEPNQAVLSQSDVSVLAVKGAGVSETLLRIVAKNSVSSRDVVLALEPDEKKKGEQ
ncbi:hypothetical protein FACS1894126_1360 [Alphaproteobacteria bacterium]|jgi:TraK protein|nr:hypothetical protein FACS1894126_1360 [Alphaproteobacteria bacterium]